MSSTSEMGGDEGDTTNYDNSALNKGEMREGEIKKMQE